MKFKSLDAWLEWQERAHPVKIDMGLERTTEVARRLELIPAVNFTVTIAGTNGKGSSVAMLESIMRHSGYRTGSFTSPHIHRYNERICVAGELVSDEQIIAAFEAIEAARGEISLSYFEFGTLAALWIFRQQRVDISILEVGLGGRLDACNVVDANIALLTSIGIDHIHFLGNDRGQIALEKAAIARAGHPVICAEPDPPETLAPYFKNLGAHYFQLGEDFSYQRERESWSWQGRHQRFSALPMPGLPGDHQFENISGVLAVCEQLPPALAVTDEAVNRSIQQVQVAGRFERYAGQPEVIFDVAHNPDAVEALASMLRTLPEKGRKIMVLGVMADKELDSMLRLLAGCIDCWIATAADMERAMSTADVAAAIAEIFPQAELYKRESCGCAWELAKELALDNDTIVIAGSFYTVAEIRALHL